MAWAGSEAGCSKEVGGGGVGGGRAVLWLLTASISERGRFTHIDSKLVSSRRGVRALDVAGGSQLGETGEQQLFVLCLLVAVAVGSRRCVSVLCV